MYLKWDLFRDAASRWMDHNAPRRGAALAYYTIFSLAPLLVIIIAIGSFFFGQQVVRGQLSTQMERLVGSQGARFIATLLRNAKAPSESIEAGALSFAVLLLGASGVFVELRQTLNEIWEVPQANDSSLWGIVRSRFFSFLMILGIGVLLLASLAASAVIHYVGAWVHYIVPLPGPAVVGIEFAITLLYTFILFALIYRYIPEADIGWQDVVIGSIVTALLFNTGKFLLGLYLGKTSVGSAYGAAGSLVVLLAWLYYSSQIFLYGAEVTRVYSDRRTAQASKLPAK